MPRITISIDGEAGEFEQDLLTLDVPGEFTVGELKGLIETEAKVATLRQRLVYNGEGLTNGRQTIKELGIIDGDLIMVHVAKTPTYQGNRGLNEQEPSSSTIGESSGQGGMNMTDEEIEGLRQSLLGNPSLLELMRQSVPNVDGIVKDAVTFRRVWREQMMAQQAREEGRNRQIEQLNADPFNVEAQKKIEEMIREERVFENLQHAYDNNPEVFAHVTMLYIETSVNGHSVKAFVDSGAQTTIMSDACAEACGIMRLIDRRFSGIAKGVGTAKILGRVHSAEIKIGDVMLPCAFTVMENRDVDLLFGLDMLKRYQACIDLKHNILRLENTEVPFLPEKDIPKTIPGLDPQTIDANHPEHGKNLNPLQPYSSTPHPQHQTPPTHTSHSSSSPAVAHVDRQVDETSIKQIVQMGFSRDIAINVLEACDGNVEMALGILMAP